MRMFLKIVCNAEFYRLIKCLAYYKTGLFCYIGGSEECENL